MHQIFKRILLFVAVSSGFLFAYGHQENENPVRFIENKGQWENHIQFRADIPGGQVYLENNKLTFNFCDLSNLHDNWFMKLPGEPEGFSLDCHAFTLEFENANPRPSIHSQKPEEYYFNYLKGQDQSRWVGKARAFKSVRYEEVYPGIDFIVYGQGQGLKYDFIVSPGANPDLIKMRFDGLEGIFLKYGQLHLNTSINKVIDDQPVSFQAEKEISSNFILQGNTVSFQFPEGFDQNQELLIDPTLVFSTFTGSTANNFGFTATYDQDGSLFAGGIAYGSGYPITTGAYQNNFGGGGFDMAISKFNSTGTMLWGTYIGGNNVDQPHSMIAHDDGDLYIFGRSQSTDYPVTQTAYDPTLNGNLDIVVSKLSADGTTLLASTYVGGNQDDGMNVTQNYQQSATKYNYGDDSRGEIVLDKNGDVYIASCTKSSDFPVTSNALQTSLSGSQDGCVFKLDSDLSTMVWSTFLGGNDIDAAYSLKVDTDEQVFVTGGTTSNNFPTTSGSLTPSFQGGVDGFVSHFNSQGTALLESSYIGNSNYNQCYFLELDRDEDVYLLGQKIGTWPRIPANIWSTPNGGGQFIMKLDNNLNSIIYSTEFGTSNNTINISPTAFLVDVCEYVYVSGWGGSTNFTGSTNNLPISSNAIQSSTDGSDLYILVLEPEITGVDFATYLGGTQSAEHVDGGTSRFNKRAEIYQSVCAGCQGNSDFPTTTGAFSSTNNSGLCNLACFKLSLDLPGVIADFTPDPDTAGCAPQFIQFDNLSAGGNSYIWDFGDGSPGSNQFSPSHNYPNPGTYIVSLIAIDSNSCNIVDTAFKTIIVLPVPVAGIIPDTSVCEGESITLAANGGQFFSWSPPTFLNSTTSSTPVATPTSTITYTVVVSNPGGCSDTAQVTVGILPKPTAQALGDTVICPGDTAAISVSGGLSYSWSPSAVVLDPVASATLAFPLGTTNLVAEVTAANGCTDQDTVLIEVSTVQADAGPLVNLCIGDGVQLNGSGGGQYLWAPPTSLSSTVIANPVADPSADITYHLTVTDVYGCLSMDSVNIVLHALPIIAAGPDELICDNDTVQFNASGGLTYTWTPPTSLSNPNIGNPNAFPTVSTYYMVEGVDQWGCRNQDSLYVDVIPAPTALAWGGATICEDSTIQLFASGGLSYIWNPAGDLDDATSPTPIAALENSTVFTVTVFALNGCDDQDTVSVPVIPTPQISTSEPPLICLGEIIRLYGYGASSYEWSTGENGNIIIIQPDSSQAITVVGYNQGCPSRPDTVEVLVDDQLPQADFYADPDSGFIPLNTSFYNQSLLASSFIWDFGDGHGSFEVNPSHVYLDTGRFVVELIAFNDNGCPDTAYSKVIVGADFTIYVPNAFTPNGDGTNDFFETPWFGVKDYHIMLFDRWGMLIYESRDPNFRWYGVFKGNDCQEGVFTYVIEANGWIGERLTRAGTVTLLR